MLTQEQVMASLETILVPGIKRSLTDMNIVQQVNVSEDRIEVTLSATALSAEVQEWLREKITGAVAGIDGAKETKIDFIAAKAKEINSIRHIMAIMSGKGGVGKSLVAGLSAVALKRQGYEVGILDADITGPSIPRMFGVTALPAGNESGILPIASKSGIEVMSMNLLLPNQDDAVIWRGPLITRAIIQFWEEVLWGKLDFLIVDLLPGTADASLTVMQTIPVSGVVIVFTPQDLVEMIVRKAVQMVRKLDKPILGTVENMAYLYLAESDRKIELFGQSRGQEMAISTGTPLLGQIALDPALARLCDEGNIERYDADVVPRLGRALVNILSAGTGIDVAATALPTEEIKKDEYSEVARDHATHPRNFGGLTGADGYGRVTGPCGDTIQIWIKVENNIIANATFTTDGCRSSIATGSITTELAKGSSIEQALKISQQDILNALGSLPEEHCTLLAANTVKEAIRDYKNRS